MSINDDNSYDEMYYSTYQALNNMINNFELFTCQNNLTPQLKMIMDYLDYSDCYITTQTNGNQPSMWCSWSLLMPEWCLNGEIFVTLPCHHHYLPSTVYTSLNCWSVQVICDLTSVTVDVMISHYTRNWLSACLLRYLHLSSINTVFS